MSASRDKRVRLWEVATGRCAIFAGHTAEVCSVSVSTDGRWLLSGGKDQTLRLWELDWELEARDPAEWDDGALPALRTFLAQHVPYTGALRPDRSLSEEKIELALTRRGKPVWGEQDFQALLRHLQQSGYGWLRPAGVRVKLAELARTFPSA